MKILIDECLPAVLKRSFISEGHFCSTVREAGFGSKKNGELLALAEGEWDVLLTSDRNMRFQQNFVRAEGFDSSDDHEVQSGGGLCAWCQPVLTHFGGCCRTCCRSSGRSNLVEDRNVLSPVSGEDRPALGRD